MVFLRASAGIDTSLEASTIHNVAAICTWLNFTVERLLVESNTPWLNKYLTESTLTHQCMSQSYCAQNLTFFRYASEPRDRVPCQIYWQALLIPQHGPAEWPIPPSSIDGVLNLPILFHMRTHLSCKLRKSLRG